MKPSAILHLSFFHLQIVKIVSWACRKCPDRLHIGLWPPAPGWGELKPPAHRRHQGGQLSRCQSLTYASSWTNTKGCKGCFHFIYVPRNPSRRIPVFGVWKIFGVPTFYQIQSQQNNVLEQGEERSHRPRLDVLRYVCCHAHDRLRGQGTVSH